MPNKLNCFSFPHCWHMLSSVHLTSFVHVLAIIPSLPGDFSRLFLVKVDIIDANRTHRPILNAGDSNHLPADVLTMFCYFCSVYTFHSFEYKSVICSHFTVHFLPYLQERNHGYERETETSLSRSSPSLSFPLFVAYSSGA